MKKTYFHAITNETRSIGRGPHPCAPNRTNL